MQFKYNVLFTLVETQLVLLPTFLDKQCVVPILQ